MKFLYFSFSKEVAFEDVSLNTAYTAAKSRQDDSDFDRVATIRADNSLLSKFWQQMCAKTIDSLREFISAAQVSDSEISFTLETSGAYDESLSPSVLTDIKDAISAGITAMWFDITFPDKSAEWHEKADSRLVRAFRMLCHRKKPSRLK